MKIIDTVTPYEVIEYTGIQYSVCRDFDHISRYRGLRQVVHDYDQPSRFVSLETPNPFHTSARVQYYDVPSVEENRLDIIAYKFLGNANYAWILAYFNEIEDGYTVHEGTRLRIPDSISSLFSKGELLSSVSPTMLNLGEE